MLEFSGPKSMPHIPKEDFARLQSEAHAAVALALNDGLMVRKPCEECGHEPSVNQRGKRWVWTVMAHHDDYEKPLDVRWLCKKCHHRYHATGLRKATKEWSPQDTHLTHADTTGYLGAKCEGAD